MSGVCGDHSGLSGTEFFFRSVSSISSRLRIGLMLTAPKSGVS